MPENPRCSDDTDHRPGAGAGKPHVLEPDELEALACSAAGRSTAEVAALLGRSLPEVRATLGHAIQKLGARSKLEAVVLALRTGLIDLPRE